MADGDPLPPEDHVTRYCKPSQAPEGRVLGTAFQLEGSHAELSLTWLECLGEGTRREQLYAAKQALIASDFTPKPNGWLASLRVGAITGLRSVGGEELHLSVLHSPDLPGNPCHSGVYGMPVAASELAMLVGIEIARHVEEPTVRVRDLGEKSDE